MSGYIKLYRKIFDSDVWRSTSAAQHEVLINILMMASWQDEIINLPSGRRLRLKPGQLATTLQAIEDACNIGNGRQAKRVSQKVVWNALSLFEELGFISRRNISSYKKDGTLITIKKWRLYQFVEDVEGKQKKSETPLPEPFSEVAFKGEEKEKQKKASEGKQKKSETPLPEPFSEVAFKKKGKQKTTSKGEQIGKSSNIQEVYKEDIYIKQTDSVNKVNEESDKNDVDFGKYSDTSQKIADYFQQRLHPFYNLTEAESVLDLANDYTEAECRACIDYMAANNINHGGSHKYLSKMLASQRQKKATNNQAGGKNDIERGYAELMAHYAKEAADENAREPGEDIGDIIRRLRSGGR